MDSTIPELLNAVVDALESIDFSPLSIIAERSYVPRRSVKDMGDTIYATVALKSVGSDRLSRAVDQRRIIVEIGVQKRLENPKDDEEFDELINLAQRIMMEFRGKKLDDVDDMTWTSGDTPTAFNGEHYDEYTVFTGVVALTYVQVI